MKLPTLIQALLLAWVTGFWLPAHAADVNLITNPSMETNVTGNTGQPLGWTYNKWGQNTTSFTYKKTEGHTGTRSLLITTTRYTSGDAKWFFNPVSATPNVSYVFSDYYKSSAATEILVRFTHQNGQFSYHWLATAPTSSSWNKVTVSFNTPSDVKSLTILHLLAGVGTLQTDDWSLTQPGITPPPPPTPDGSNLVPNPSLETPSATNPGLPDGGWQTEKARTNTVKFTYLTSGHSGSRALKTEITQYTSGDAYWTFPQQAVTGGKLYEFSDWYQSNVDTEVYAHITMLDGTEEWLYIGTAFQSPGWNHFYQQFTLPANAVSVDVYHSLYQVGFLITDDYKLSAYAPVGFTRPLISLTFDEVLLPMYTYGLPIMKKYNFLTTQYFQTSDISYPGYVTPAIMKEFADAGHEIGTHSLTHPDMTKLTAAELDYEMSQPQIDLFNWTGVKPVNFSSPYGAYNSDVIASAKKYYRSHRSVDVGYNSKDNFDIWNIKAQSILSTTTTAELMTWVNRAKADKTWLVLVYHNVNPNTTQGGLYNTPPDLLDAHFAAMKASGVAVVPVNKALDELLPQLP